MLLQQPLSIKKSLPLLMMHWGQVDVSSVDQRFKGLLSDLSLCALRQTLFFGREDPLCFIPMNDLGPVCLLESSFLLESEFRESIFRCLVV